MNYLCFDKSTPAATPPNSVEALATTFPHHHPDINFSERKKKSLSFVKTIFT